jgi:hypothetical protein
MNRLARRPAPRRSGRRPICWKPVPCDAPERSVHIRVGEHEGRIYLDLADKHWRTIEIGLKGWRVVSSPPVRFRRAAGMLPLPMPQRGRCIQTLATFLNLPGWNEFVLILAWLLAALRPSGPYPLLAIAGEQGSAKTVLTKSYGSAGCARGTRWGARTRPYRRDRCRLRDRLERALPHRGCRIHLRRSQYPPNQNHPGIPDASTRTRRARLKFQIFLASLLRDIKLRFAAPLANYAQCIFASGNSVNNLFRNECYAGSDFPPRARN